jgi:hypothetical protein
MNTKTLLLLGATVFLAGATELLAADAVPATKPAKSVEAKVGFQKLKTLAGTWEGTSNESTNKCVLRYQVTSGGSVVMETIGPGSPHEMVTMYHLDGDDLVLVHYCAARNQPRMKLDRKKSTADELIFDFDGGTNLNPGKDGHMHALRINFTGPDSVEAHWTYHQNGKPAGDTEFKLKRAKP